MGPCIGSCEKPGVRTQEALPWDGIPENPKEDGFHWLKEKGGGKLIPFEWYADEELWLFDDDGGFPDRARGLFSYHGPCLPPGASTEQRRKDAEPVAWLAVDRSKSKPGKAFTPDFAVTEESKAKHFAKFNFDVTPLYTAPPPDDRDATITTLREALETTCKALERVEAERMVSYKARNGRDCHIQADDGERCDILHSDITFECKNAFEDALKALAPAEKE